MTGLSSGGPPAAGAAGFCPDGRAAPPLVGRPDGVRHVPPCVADAVPSSRDDPAHDDGPAPSGVGAVVGERGRAAQACLVSQKIFAISSILAMSWSATAGSMLCLVPPPPASLVASLNSVCSSGYFSKCGGLK